MEGGRRRVAGGEGLHLRSGREGQERRGVMQPAEGRALQEHSRDACEESYLGTMSKKRLKHLPEDFPAITCILVVSFLGVHKGAST